MSGQLTEMQGAGKQTSDLIEATQMQAFASRRIVAAGRQQSHAADKNAEAGAAFAASANQIREETAKAVGELRRAADATVEATQLNERPWLTPLRYILSGEAVAGKSFEFKIMVLLQNTGKTPAIDSMPISAGGEWTRNQAPPLLTINPHITGWHQLIPPTQISAAGSTGISFTTDPVTIPDPTLYVNGGNDIYLRGQLNYCDVYGVPHWTTFCVVHEYGTSLEAFMACIGPTAVDHNTKAGPPCNGNQK